MDERYLSQIEQSRTSTKSLPLEVIENVQEAIWAGITGSVKAVLHRLVDLALQDEATERVGAGRHERSAGRRAHRNGTYTRDLQTTLGPIEDLRSLASGCPTAALLEDGRRSTGTSGGPTSSTG